MPGFGFRPPRMTFGDGGLERWEAEIAFTLVEAPFEVVAPVAAKVVRARQGPSGAVEGERRPPALALSDMQAAAEKGLPDPPGMPLFEGALIFAPAEAPHLTVIEHPLDFVGPEELPVDLGRVMDKTRMITFDSSLDKRHRQHHGMRCRLGNTLLRRAALSRGYETKGWHWDEFGDPLPFEDPSRLTKKRIWERMDRKLLFDYAVQLGLDPVRSLFGRDFAASVLHHPLAFDAPEAEIAISGVDPSIAFAAGVKPTTGLDTPDSKFAETATLMAAMMRWHRTIDQARWKAAQSAKRAKTPAGRERAQWRLIEAVRDVVEDMRCFDIAESHILLLFDPLRSSMRELGKETEAYRVFKGLARHPFGAFLQR